MSVLDNLADYLLGNPAREITEDVPVAAALPKYHSSPRQLSLIVLDSATAFNWPDRFDAEIARLEKQPITSGSNKTTAESTSALVLSKLKELQKFFGSVVIYTTCHAMTQVPQSAVRHHQYQTVIPQQTVNPNPLHYQHEDEPEQRPVVVPPPPNPQKQTQILSPWQTQATLSLNLTPIPTPQFQATQMTLQDCLRDRNRRQEVVNQRRVHISVNEDWLDKFISIDAANHNVKDGTESELATTVSKSKKDGKLAGFVIAFGKSPGLLSSSQSSSFSSSC